MTKISPNLLKFGVKTLHHVSCPANEASAKIRSGSGLFRRFSALLVHAAPVVKTLSRLYDVLLSVMVLQCVCSAC